MIRYWTNFAAKETKALIASDEDPTRLFAGKSTQYRKSKSLPKFTGEAIRTCATINRIFFDDPDEAYRLFHEFVPDAGEGVQFTPPFNVDYGIGLTIGRGAFLNKDFMVCGGGYVTLGAVASVPSLRLDETDCTSHAMHAMQVSA